MSDKKRTIQTVKQEHKFMGYGANYYRVLIKQALYFVDDVEFLAKLSTLILEKLDKETRERILRELEFMTRKRDDIALEKVRWKLEELSKLVSPIFCALGFKRSEVSLGSVVALLPAIDIAMLFGIESLRLQKIEDIVIEIAELVDIWYLDTTSRISYYSIMKDSLSNLRVKIDCNCSVKYDADVKHVVEIIRKLLAVPKGKRHIAYWAAIVAAKIKNKRPGIEYIDDFNAMVKILDGEVYTTLLTMLMHYETRIVYQLAERGFDALFDLPERFKQEVAKWVNYWMIDFFTTLRKV